MVINFKNIPFYYLNGKCYPDRKIKMEDITEKMGISATGILNESDLPRRQDRISEGFIKVLSTAIEHNVFPCITMDDDISLITTLPETIDIPCECDIIVLGGSLYDCGGIKPNMYITEYNSEFYRLYYGLSLHSIIIPRISVANSLLKLTESALSHGEFLDILITMESENMLFLTPKNGPYFYQDNYNSTVTNFLWENVKDKRLNL